MGIEAGTEVLEYLALDCLIFCCRFDNEIAASHIVQALRHMNSPESRIDDLFPNQPARCLPVHVARDGFCGAIQSFGVDVLQHDIYASKREHVSDARSHLACADDANTFDVHGFASMIAQ
jgi:hypothetical protein